MKAFLGGWGRMDRVQAVLAGIGGIFLLWFAVPLVAKGIFNLGNLTGIILSGMLFFYGIFRERAHVFASGLWRTRGGRAFLLAVAVLALCSASIAAVETILMVRAAHNKPPAGTTAVLLGCSVKGTRPSTVLEERLKAAYAYLKENPGTYCVLSGGRGRGEEITEAECMYRYLTERGIDGKRLILEESSTDTEENLRFAGERLAERGLGKEITVITSEFHAYRASLMASKLGFTCYSTPSKTFFLYFPTYYVRELYGILYYQIAK